MDLSNIKILRKSISNKYPTTITTSLEENISLQNGDYINILNKNTFEPIESIIITGEINSPGVYQVNGLTTLSEILRFTGGYTDFALKMELKYLERFCSNFMGK